MSDSGFERIASGAGSLFFLAAIALFVTLILLATGMVRAQEVFLIADSLEPDALEEDALEPDALGEDALGLERVDPALIRQLAAQPNALPIAQIPPRPRQAITMYFCWRCWSWHRGHRGGLGDEYQWINGFIYPAVPGERASDLPVAPVKKLANEGNKK